MKHKLHLTIPTPCHERWDEMTPTDRGAFCHSCRKEVIDFSAMTDADVIRWLEQHNTACGRFRADQLDRDMSLPLVNNSPLRWKVLLMSMLPAFSLTPLAARAVLPAPMDQMPQKSKADTATAKVDTTTSACDTTLIGVCGKVLDENGEGLIGATVQITDDQGKTTGQGCAADLDGNFTIPLQQPDTVNLKVTSIGYETQLLIRIPAGHPYIVFKMKPMPATTGEIIMVGGLVGHRPTTAQRIKWWFRRTFHHRG